MFLLMYLFAIFRRLEFSNFVGFCVFCFRGLALFGAAIAVYIVFTFFCNNFFCFVSW